ncbi:hypothetical protein E2C01_087859 [Portunus trituberculatus]|uniref:Uncharacterized protein n=1 Tax=Portunus trituberculatus TaxID=210409 RepID=A0A5B7JEH0_PORTR|nr:hypothetical protein [Portunus trituberculatus]
MGRQVPAVILPRTTRPLRCLYTSPDRVNALSLHLSQLSHQHVLAKASLKVAFAANDEKLTKSGHLATQPKRRSAGYHQPN